MQILDKFENWISTKLSIGSSKDSAAIVSHFDSACCSFPHNVLFKLRAVSFNPRFLARKIKKLTNTPCGAVKVLDVGCNVGAKTPLFLDILRELKCIKPEILGIDISKQAIEIAQKKNTRNNITYRQADFLSGDFQSDNIDFIFLAAVWHHLRDHKLALEKIEKSLKPGGIAIIFNGFYPENRFFRILGLIFQKIYCYIEKRHGLHYEKPLISQIERQIHEHCPALICKGHFTTNFPTSLFNTKMLIIQKKL